MKKLLTLFAAVVLSAQAGYCAGAALENLQGLGDVKNVSVPLPASPIKTAAVVRAAKTQTIVCKDSPDTLKITMVLNNGRIEAARVEYWGKYLTPGLYHGQSLGANSHVFNEPYNPALMGLVGGNTDPSSDNPYLFRAALHKNLIGKAASAGAFSVYFEHMPDYGSYAITPQAAYVMLKKDGKLSNPVGTLPEWKNCGSYIE